MIGRALDAGVPCAWVLGDEIYGSDRRLRMDLERREQPFVLAVRSNEKLWAVLGGRLGQHAAAVLAKALPASAWQSLSAGTGAKGERLYDWARVRLMRLQEPPWDHWLLVRRSRKDPKDLAYYVVFGPEDATLATLARVAGRRWAVEECFEAAKQEVGLADYEIRSWHGWRRHITLAMLALAFLAGMRVKLSPGMLRKKGTRRPDLWSISAQARSAISSAGFSSQPA
jgi:SRSO17 transposase